jgi:hypothetical protein
MEPTARNRKVLALSGAIGLVLLVVPPILAELSSRDVTTLRRAIAEAQAASQSTAPLDVVRARTGGAPTGGELVGPPGPTGQVASSGGAAGEPAASDVAGSTSSGGTAGGGRGTSAPDDETDPGATVTTVVAGLGPVPATSTTAPSGAPALTTPTTSPTPAPTPRPTSPVTTSPVTTATTTPVATSAPLPTEPAPVPTEPVPVPTEPEPITDIPPIVDTTLPVIDTVPAVETTLLLEEPKKPKPPRP